VADIFQNQVSDFVGSLVMDHDVAGALVARSYHLDGAWIGRGQGQGRKSVEREEYDHNNGDAPVISTRSKLLVRRGDDPSICLEAIAASLCRRTIVFKPGCILS
jgi:hypothetical protein